MKKIFDKYKKYCEKIISELSNNPKPNLIQLSESLVDCLNRKGKVFICGNGGSASNAMHLENDFIYKNGLRAEALTANSSVLTCLANDVGYGDIFSDQLTVKADKDDILIVLSGSGNSSNIIKALEVGNKIGMQTFAIVGFSGGRSKEIAKYPIHFEIDDMQIAEDLQLIIGHICTQWLSDKLV